MRLEWNVTWSLSSSIALATLETANIDNQVRDNKEERRRKKRSHTAQNKKDGVVYK